MSSPQSRRNRGRSATARRNVATMRRTPTISHAEALNRQAALNHSASLRRNAIYNPDIAKNYAREIEVVRGRLREKRGEYRVAKFLTNTAMMIQKLKDFANLIKTDWPYYINGIDRAQAPYPTNALPYPSDQILQLTSVKQRWRILATALLARRSIEQRKMYEGLVPKLTGALSIEAFKTKLTKYLGEVDQVIASKIENLVAMENARPLATPTGTPTHIPMYGVPLPGYSPARITRVPTPPSPPPAYSSQENYILDTGGHARTKRRRRTRQRKTRKRST